MLVLTSDSDIFSFKIDLKIRKLNENAKYFDQPFFLVSALAFVITYYTVDDLEYYVPFDIDHR